MTVQFVMVGLVAAIHVCTRDVKTDVDARHEAGHDENQTLKAG